MVLLSTKPFKADAKQGQDGVDISEVLRLNPTRRKGGNFKRQPPFRDTQGNIILFEK